MTPDNSLIEHVARELFEFRFNQPGLASSGLDWKDICIRDRALADVYRDNARTAIKAMRNFQ